MKLVPQFSQSKPKSGNIMGQNQNVIHCSWHWTRSRFKNGFKIPRSIGLTVIAAMCNIWLAHPPNTCLCNGYGETNHVSIQFYFLALFKMEQTLEYLSYGKFQYCNICFRRLKILYNSCFVCLWKKNHVIWKCGSVAINLFVDVTALGMTVPFPPYIMPLEELLSSRMYGSRNSSYSLCSLTVAIDTALLPQLHPSCYRWNKKALLYILRCFAQFWVCDVLHFAGSDSTAQQVSHIAVYLQCCLLHLVLMTDQKGRELHNF